MKQYDVIIIGGGAAGLMCAITAGKRGRKVLILDSANKVGKKILMSGGGRCNFTNLHTSPEYYLSHNPHFCKSALKQYTQWDFIALVQQHNIPYHEKTLGQLFCDHSSKDILTMLLDESRQLGVTIHTNCSIHGITADQHYSLKTNLGIFASESLVIATGGLSIPKMGATDFGYNIAEQFGLRVWPTTAGLVPFVFTDAFKTLSEKLSGISVDVEIKTARKTFREALLFTHRGLSGPAVLQASSYWQESEDIAINLLPDLEIKKTLLKAKYESPKALLRSIIAMHLPKKLVTELETLWWPNSAEKPLIEFSDAKLTALAKQFSSWHVKPAGTEGYRTAEVTLGGVDTRDLSSKTMECLHQENLFFIGEVVDVTGHLGGYNFQWAWSSGYVAGQSA